METDLVPGKYQLTESDNFDNFMGALGVGYLVRSDAPARLKLFQLIENISGSWATAASRWSPSARRGKSGP